MSGADAFAAVADRLDLFTDRVRYERYVAHGGIAGWCRKAGRDAWDRYHREQAPWFRKKEPEMSNREKWETTTSNSRSGRGRDAWT